MQALLCRAPLFRPDCRQASQRCLRRRSLCALVLGHATRRLSFSCTRPSTLPRTCVCSWNWPWVMIWLLHRLARKACFRIPVGSRLNTRKHRKRTNYRKRTPGFAKNNILAHSVSKTRRAQKKVSSEDPEYNIAPTSKTWTAQVQFT